MSTISYAGVDERIGAGGMPSAAPAFSAYAIGIQDERDRQQAASGYGMLSMVAYMQALQLLDLNENNGFLSIYSEYAALDIADENMDIRAWGQRQGLSRSQIDAIIADPDERLVALGAARLERGTFSAEPLRLSPDQVQDRQRVVASTIDDAAAAAGVSPDLMRGMWGVESGFGTHRTLVSPTGCSGDWQFSRGTFAAVMRTHMDEIPTTHLSEAQQRILADFAAGRISGSDGEFQQLRFDPVVSTYAAAFYMREVADQVGVSAIDRENFGVIYAGYNVGPGNAARLQRMADNGDMRSARGVLGRVAALNPMFYQGGVNADGALDNYQAAVERRLADYHSNGLSTLENGGTMAASFDRAAGPSAPRAEQRGIVQQVADVAGDAWSAGGRILNRGMDLVRDFIPG
ncbi:MAG: hypothetical protein GC136_05340 [Alphaproteobacteria bacterium]|nr:hypothetical protein [Alphaproteobacteria bacterium]